MSVSFGAVTTKDTGSTSLAVTYPSGIEAGNLIVMVIANKYPTNGPADISGWTKLQSQGGAGDPGGDSGQAYCTVFYKVAAGTESGDVTVTITSGNSAVACMVRYAKTLTDWSITYTTGAQNTAAETWAVDGAGSIALASGDVVLACVAINGNATLFGSQSLSASGITFGSAVERFDDNTSTGQDCAAMISEHPVSSGSGTVTPSFGMASTSGGVTTAGAVVFLRLRDEDPESSTVVPIITYLRRKRMA